MQVVTWLASGGSLALVGAAAIAVRGLVEIVLVLLVPRSERVRAIRALRGRRGPRRVRGYDDARELD